MQGALEMTNRDDTLIIVTADHSHTMTINGYPKRGNPILGLVVDATASCMLGGDGKPYTTLGYANGPGGVFPALAEGPTAAEPAGVRPDLTGVDTTVDRLHAAGDWCRSASETHAGDDVAIYAWGPWAHLFCGHRRAELHLSRDRPRLEITDAAAPRCTTDHTGRRGRARRRRASPAASPRRHMVGVRSRTRLSCAACAAALFSGALDAAPATDESASTISTSVRRCSTEKLQERSTAKPSKCSASWRRR